MERLYFYLSGFGRQLVQTGRSQGWSYTDGGAQGPLGPVVEGPEIRALAAALEAGDLGAVREALAALPPDLAGSFALRRRRTPKGWALDHNGAGLGDWYFEARDTALGWPEPTAVVDYDGEADARLVERLRKQRNRAAPDRVRVEVTVPADRADDIRELARAINAGED